MALAKDDGAASVTADLAGIMKKLSARPWASVTAWTPVALGKLVTNGYFRDREHVTYRRRATGVRMSRIVLAAVLALGGSTVLGAQTYVVHRLAPNPEGYGQVRIEKAALPGQEVRVWWAMTLNPDCTPGAAMTAQIVQPPRHGTARLSDDPFYPNFVAPNPRAACDAKPAPGKQAFYTAEAGFHGHDKFVLQNATSEGRIRKITVDVDVR